MITASPRRLFILCATAFIAACSSGGGGGTTNPPPPTTASITVVNNSGLTINEVHIAPAGTTTWGANQITSPIYSGSSRTITGIAAGSYSLQAVASTGESTNTDAVALTGGNTYTWTLTPPAPPATASLTVVNNSGLTIDAVYIAPTGTTTWGSNQISTPIYDGSSRTVTSIPAGTYDVKAVASTGETVEQYAVTFTGGTTYTWTLTPPTPTTASLQLTNNHAASITELYVVQSSASGWGTNQLSSAIAPYGQFTVTAIPAGTYDLRAVASDGVYWERYGVNFGAGTTSTWTLYPPANGSLKVVNSSSYTVSDLYVVASPNGYNGTWGSNQMSTTLPPGYSYTVTNISPGNWDVGATSLGGTTYWTNYNVPITAGQTYTLTLY